MKQKLWWRLAGVGLLTLFFIWQLVPYRLTSGSSGWHFKRLAWTDILRPGIDLAGGTRLVYQVEQWKGASGANPAEDLIKVLKQRVNPDGTKDIQFRAIGSDRIEIVIPKATASSTDAGLADKECLKQLLATNVIPSDVEKARTAPPARRMDAFMALVRGVTSREESLRQLAAAWDKLAKVEAESPATQPNDKPSAAVKKARDEYNAAFGAVLATNVHEDDIQRVMRMTDKERKLQPKLPDGTADPNSKPPLDALLAQYSDRTDKINALVDASDQWKKEKQAVDDPNDLKRLLRGSGVLEFYIAVQPEENVNTSQLLDEKGNIRSVKIPGEQYAWVGCDPATAGKGGAVTGRYLGVPYVLVYNTPDKSLKHAADNVWKFVTAHPIRDQWNNPAVAFEFDERGGAKFGTLTSNNLKKPLCAVLDGKAISIATIQSKINTNGEITGSFSNEEALDLANKMQAGALPGSLSPEPISEASVDAQLGSAQRSAGLKAAVIGLIAVVVFMLIYYLVPLGLVADIAVLFNLLYLLGMMAWGKFSFTMPGIAGLILTVGIAVDANVLIDERIREEQAKGLNLRTALKNGYSRAFSVIIDAHLTAIITTVILYFVGTTEIKGFATTLGIGLVFSLFTSVFLTRWLLQLAIEYGWIKDHVRMLKVIGVPKIGWMNKRYVFWGISAATILLGLVAFSVQDPAKKYDVEFIGGTKAQVTLAHIPGRDLDEETVQRLLKARNVDSQGKTTALFEGVSVRPVELGAEAEAKGRTFEIVAPAPEQAQTAAFREGIIKATSDPQGKEGLGTKSLLLENRDALEFDQEKDWASIAEAWRSNRAYLPGKLPADAFIINESYMPQAGDVNLDPFKTGLVMVVTLRKAATLEDLRSRIGAQLNTPEYEILPPSRMAEVSDEATSGWELYGLTAAPVPGGSAAPGGVEGATQFTKVLYVARANLDPEKAGPGSSEWLNKFALAEVAALHDALHNPQPLNSITYFSPSIASDLVLKAWLAIILSMVAIMIYIWVRFGNWLFGLGAIVPIFHDAGVVIGLVAISKFVANTWFGHALLIGDFRFDLTVVAAVLTVIGYSTNDTIVVFDRIRENRGRLAYVSGQLIDNSVNQTLSRTILTSLTVFLVIIIMYVLGGQGIRAFNFAMLVGVVTGTYSSIAIAAPVLLGWRRMVHKKLVGGPDKPGAPGPK